MLLRRQPHLRCLIVAESLKFPQGEAQLCERRVIVVGQLSGFHFHIAFILNCIVMRYNGQSNSTKRDFV